MQCLVLVHFSVPTFGCDKNVVILGEKNSSSLHAFKNKKTYMALGEDPTERLDDTMIAADVKYSINFTGSRNF